MNVALLQHPLAALGGHTPVLTTGTQCAVTQGDVAASTQEQTSLAPLSDSIQQQVDPEGFVAGTKLAKVSLVGSRSGSASSSRTCQT
jgi:hypothetical protein